MSTMRRFTKMPFDMPMRVRRTLPVLPEPVTGPPPLTYRDTREDEEAVPFGLRVAAGIAWRVIVVAAALYGLLRLIGYTSSVVIPVAVALLLTSLLMPLAVFFNHRLRFPRGLAAAVTLLVGISVVVGLLTVAGGQIVAGLSELGTQVNTGVGQIQSWLENGPLQIGGPQISQAIEQATAWVQQNAGTLTSGALAGAVTAGNFVVGTIMCLFAVFFFLSDGDRMWSWFVRLAPEQTRTPIHEAGRRAWVSLTSYVKTQVVVAGVDALFIGVGAAVLGLPLAIPLGLIVFFSASIPIVGALASGALAVLLALVVKGPVTALIMLGIILAVQQIEGNLLQPILMSKAVSLHPLATLLGVAVGSYAFGIVGALFAVPVMAVTNTVVLYLNGHDKFPMLAQNASVLTNSAKELSGDKAAKKHGEEITEPGDDSPRIGDITHERTEQQQEEMDAQTRRLALEESADQERGSTPQD